MVPADSGRVSPAPPYSGYSPADTPCVYGTVTPCGLVFQTSSTSVGRPCASPSTPSGMPDGLGSSAFARHYSRNHCCFLFLRVLRCFSSPGRSPCGSPVFNRGGSPIRTPADQRSFAPPRSFSQLTASFVIAGSLGIPRAPFSCFLLLGACRAIPGTGAFSFLFSIASRLVNELFRARPLAGTPDAAPSRARTGSPPNGGDGLSVSLLVEDKGFEPLTPSLQS